MTRRIITGMDANGNSHIAADSPGFDFGTLTELWATDSAPAPYGSDDEIAGRRVKLEPPASGTVFRFFRVEPEDPNLSRDDLEQGTAAGFAAVGAEHCRPNTARDPRMHTTRSVDYIVLLRGEVTLLLDEGEVDLKPFDVVIQRGTNHAWINKGTEVAELVGILVDAETR
jgi:mannose-6-phosphate isomerase-like protein (cupin superfamily)